MINYIFDIVKLFMNHPVLHDLGYSWG